MTIAQGCWCLGFSRKLFFLLFPFFSPFLTWQLMSSVCCQALHWREVYSFVLIRLGRDVLKNARTLFSLTHTHTHTNSFTHTHFSYTLKAERIAENICINLAYWHIIRNSYHLIKQNVITFLTSQLVSSIFMIIFFVFQII